VFKREFMHLPVWAWVLFGGAGLYLLYQLYQKRQTTAQAATTPTSSTDPAAASSTDPGNIFFLPNQSQPLPTQVGVNFNSRPTTVASNGTNNLVYVGPVTPGTLPGVSKATLYHPYTQPSASVTRG
jgi:hypothetical protein